MHAAAEELMEEQCMLCNPIHPGGDQKLLPSDVKCIDVSFLSLSCSSGNSGVSGGSLQADCMISVVRGASEAYWGFLCVSCQRIHRFKAKGVNVAHARLAEPGGKLVHSCEQAQNLTAALTTYLPLSTIVQHICILAMM